MSEAITSGTRISMVENFSSPKRPTRAKRACHPVFDRWWSVAFDNGNYTLDFPIFLQCRVLITRCAIFFASFVSSGKFDGAVVMGLYPWDVAATSLLVSEAGGKVTGINGELFDYSTGDLVATNGKIHNDLLAFMRKK